MEGTVTRIRSVLCEVDAGGQAYVCKARRRLVASETGESKPVAVGDRVVLTPTGPGEAVIEEVLPRRTKLSRRSPGDVRTEHVIVTNVDQLLVVCSVRRPPLTLGIIDRYIIAGHSGGLDPIVCINKMDLAKDRAEYLDPARTYEEMGYSVLLTSARAGTGLESFKSALRGKSTVLAGHSGVGKSSLINAIQPGLKLKTGPVNAKGRHITAGVSLLRLDFGGYVVDTPGIREFTLWDMKKSEVAQFFPQIWELAPRCRLPACLHLEEPDCAVKRGVESRELPASQYERYVRIAETLVENPRVPRATDVEVPAEQIGRKKRALSRRKMKQVLRETGLEEVAEEAEEEPEPGPA